MEWKEWLIKFKKWVEEQKLKKITRLEEQIRVEKINVEVRKRQQKLRALQRKHRPRQHSRGSTSRRLVGLPSKEPKSLWKPSEEWGNNGNQK